MLDRESIDAVLINAQHNFTWLTGGRRNGVDGSRENGVASLVITRHGHRYLLASAIEMERMLTEEVGMTDFQPVDFTWQDEKADTGFWLEKARFLLGAGATLATDIAFDRGTPSIEGKIAACRYELTPHEIERYRSLGHDAGAAAENFIEKIAPGETEQQIAAKFRAELGSHNIDSVVTLVAADERIARFRHPVPTEKRWRHTLLIVTCAKRHGLIASLSRLICVGKIPDELRSKTEAAAFVNSSLLAATHVGTAGSELYSIAARAYAERGFADEINRHHQGGATGYKTRDWVAHPKSRESVKTNQAFAWNPSVAGTKIEDTYIAGENGVEIITCSSGFPSITIPVNGTDFTSAGILSLSNRIS